MIKVNENKLVDVSISEKDLIRLFKENPILNSKISYVKKTAVLYYPKTITKFAIEKKYIPNRYVKEDNEEIH